MDGDITRLGPYELYGEIGRGAMAKVWRAKDPNLGRDVAIKEPLFDAGLSDDVREELAHRFVKEARTVASLNHPNIVTIFAADVYDGRPAIVMELVEGTTLGQLLGNGPLNPTEALGILDQLLDAVDHAHSKGVVHRDIKPENIFVNSEGRVKLSDFGVARVDHGVTRNTVEGTLLGTPGYMSPEQARGNPVDGRSDLFSVGVVAYEMLAGRNPFGAGDGADAVTLLYRIVHEPVAELPDNACEGLPADLRPAIMAALAKDPSGRPQSAREFKALLHEGRAPEATAALRGAIGSSLGGAIEGAQTAATPSTTPVGIGNATVTGADNAGAAGIASASTTGIASDAPSNRRTPKWLPYALVAAACVAAIGIGFFALGATQGGGGASGGTTTKTSSTAATKMYHLAVSDGYVSIFTNSSDEPYQVTNVRASDLDDDAAAEVDDNISFDTIDEAKEQVEAYRKNIETAQKEAERKAAEEEAARKSEEAKRAEEETARKAAEEEAARKAAEEEARRAAEEAARQAELEAARTELARQSAAEANRTTVTSQSNVSAASVVASMDGWWQSPFQPNACGYISGGTFTIYRPDYPSGNFYRTISASDLVRCADGLPGHFDGVPGFRIPASRDGDMDYYVTDADFNDNGRIDEISHINSDGSGYRDDQTFHRTSKPSYAN